MAGRQHSVSKLLRMTPQEAKILERKSKEAGMSESEYLRFMMTQKPSDYPELKKLLKELINEVNRIGVNINQITLNHNTGFYSEGDKMALTAYMRKLITGVDEVVKQIGN